MAEWKFKEGDRVSTPYLDKGTVVEYLGDFDFPKVRVLIDGEESESVWHADSLRPDVPEKNLERVLVIAENSESSDALLLAAEVRRLRAMEERMNRLADAYAANVVMLTEKAQSPDGLLGIMAECSLGAAKLIRKAIEGE